MALFWQIVSLLSVWLLYGLAASFFVKNVNKRDYLLLISSGLIGGLLGGRIGNILDVPENIWWLREVIKFGITILSMHTLHNVFKWRKYKK
ncbi:MAG: hypothetical protein VYA37_02205 [Actinomycetota bacterium]|jgi:uncharacterized membrane protein YeaQ/YmgE (transglycosylase-associated protein family)|nr:hypothetical protein [Actinomycetota bacterium]MEC7925921.1 hypothetical protein [Actinomycetota bacterium]|tara:strand:+ start:57 stop:329 length:273 start_codon:yes stop_codon:yes gene_type:complete